MVAKQFLAKPAVILAIAASLAIIIAAIASPAISKSINPCSSCHGAYSQYLDILEVDGSNQIPLALNVGESKTVIVTIENQVNTARYTSLFGVSATLKSTNGHFSVATSTVSIGTLFAGTKTVTWQITGTSVGADSIIITVNGRNSHENLPFSDSYLPAPSISVGNVAAPPIIPEPQPTPSPTPAPASTPAPVATPSPTPDPAPQPVPILPAPNTTLPTPTNTSPETTQKPPSEPTPTLTDPKQMQPTIPQQEEKTPTNENSQVTPPTSNELPPIENPTQNPTQFNRILDNVHIMLTMTVVIAVIMLTFIQQTRNLKRTQLKN